MFATGDDTEESKAARAATRARISELDIEIETLKHSLETLLLERTKCREALDTYRYPVLMLPAEITSEIFTNFLPAYPERSPLVGPSSPSFLTNISRRWRDVALSTPTLWSSFHLNLNIPRRHEQQLRLLELWLDRSGACPLSLELVHDLDSGNSTASFTEAVMRHAHRWEEVYLILPRDELYRITVPTPLLRTLIIGPKEQLDATTPVAAPVVMFSQAPKLKGVVLTMFFNPFSITLPWLQITTLTAHLYDVEAATILRETMALEECRFTLYCSFSEVPIHPIPPILHLHSLSLLSPGIHAVSMEHLLAALDLPALENFTVDEPFLGKDPVVTLSALLRNSHPRRIEISRVRSTSDTAPYDMYAAAFPTAILSVELESVSRTSSGFAPLIHD
ncbi:hypothetical protein B0H11DRAFT_1035182 [Mycena galericulata]|nr:hypothetical protein B0H11DRAFT_1861138 [Mycena galericulata]KAJ7510912.1 hypothetical protein B0H11DRAFT_1035182 [Mycena galericulata]